MQAVALELLEGVNSDDEVVEREKEVGAVMGEEMYRALSLADTSSVDTTENCMACGRASRKAVNQMAKMNLTARDNLDMVCCLQSNSRKIQKKDRE